MRPTSSRAFRLAPAIVLFLPACGVTLKDHTPPEFPWVSIRDYSTDALYQATPSHIQELGLDSAHRFLLEIRPRGVSNISAYVTVNGGERRMREYQWAGGGSRLWIYENANECQSSYDYHYRVSYKINWFGGLKNATLGSSAEPLQAGVSGAGDLVWFLPGASVHPSDEGGYPEIRFVQDGTDTLEWTITIQNLRSTPVALYAIRLDDGATFGTHNDEFQVLDVPAAAAGDPLPPAQSFILDCGESLTFRVIWNGQTVGATGALSMHAWEQGGGGFEMHKALLLTGYPHPG